MATAPIDDMTAFALEEVLSGDGARLRKLVRRMCQRWPEAPALSVSFALSSAAAMIGDTLEAGTDRSQSAYRTYRMSAIFAADVFAAESLLGRRAEAHDLLHFWRRVDPYYMGD